LFFSFLSPFGLLDSFVSQAALLSLVLGITPFYVPFSGLQILFVQSELNWISLQQIQTQTLSISHIWSTVSFILVPFTP
jgi:hypothetical protein